MDSSGGATDIKHGPDGELIGPGWQSGQFPSPNADGGSSYAAGSRPVVPSRDAWVQNGRAKRSLARKIPTPALYISESFISEYIGTKRADCNG